MLCATERFPSGEPDFRQISDQIQLTSDESSQLIIVTQDGKSFGTGDFAEQRDGSWLVRSSSTRLDPRVRDHLEDWGEREWSRRTGYLHASDAGFEHQLREHVSSSSEDELYYHLFWHRFGGSVTMKPKWSWHHA
ncbi:MAG: hypothetical protein WCH39_29760 [Schlesneria sp.]